MKSIIITLIFTSLTLFAKQEIKRFALLVGANNGGKERVKLAFAHTDANSMAKVLKELGGLSKQDEKTLYDPSIETLQGAFLDLKKEILTAKKAGKKTQVIFYYSGHSDEKGLLLGEEQLPYGALKASLNYLKSDVQIAILDSCASGAMIRQKGGKWRPSFLSDGSSMVSGHAILTSSSASEVAQESDRIGGSFFTHYMISGLRGAADRSSDKKVTLNEAYEYAFHKTLKRTQGTRSGPQHPSYDFQLAGSGDLVLTDLRSTSSLLVLPKMLIGRIFIRNQRGDLIAEIDKLQQKPLRFGLEPGQYTIAWEYEKKMKVGRVKLMKHQQITLNPEALSQTDREFTVARGNTPVKLKNLPLSVGLIPGISMNSMSTIPTLNNISYGLLIDDGYATRGVSVAQIGSIKQGWLEGVQLGGLFNILKGRLDGAQIAGIFNIAHAAMDGVQIAGIFNIVKGSADGGQIAGIFNNSTGNVDGFQIAGIVNNNTRTIDGFQIAGITNIARGKVDGFQISGIANLAQKDVNGFQISGLLNTAKDVDGIQIGLINVADDSTFSIGLINIMRKGRFHLSGLIDDQRRGHLEMKHGGSHWHMIYSGGWDLSDENQITLGIGFGFHIPVTCNIFTDIDLIDYSTIDTRKSFEDNDWDRNHATIRLQLGYYINEDLAITAGAALNVMVQPGDFGKPDGFSHWLVKDGQNDHDELDVYLWPSLTLGIQLF